MLRASAGGHAEDDFCLLQEPGARRARGAGLVNEFTHTAAHSPDGPDAKDTSLTVSISKVTTQSSPLEAQSCLIKWRECSGNLFSSNPRISGRGGSCGHSWLHPPWRYFSCAHPAQGPLPWIPKTSLSHDVHFEKSWRVTSKKI